MYVLYISYETCIAVKPESPALNFGPVDSKPKHGFLNHSRDDPGDFIELGVFAGNMGASVPLQNYQVLIISGSRDGAGPSIEVTVDFSPSVAPTCKVHVLATVTISPFCHLSVMREIGGG